MRGRIFKVIFLTLGILFFSCSKGEVRSEEPLRTSSIKPPEWILKRKTSSSYYYFVGIGKKEKDIQKAKKTAIEDGVSRLLEYIGLRATTSFKMTKEFKEENEEYSYKEEIIKKLEGKAEAEIRTEIEEVYYEEYRDGFIFYVLIRSQKEWIEKERERLKQLALKQRESSIYYLEKAKTSFENGEVIKAIDYCLNGLEISGKAMENSDVYEEIKAQLLQTLSSIRISCLSKQLLVYEEGISDEMRLKITSIRNNSPIEGIALEYFSDEDLEINSRNGLKSDENGIVSFYVIKKKTPSSKNIKVNFSFSMKPFENIKESDEELYFKINDINKLNGLTLVFEVKEKFKALVSAVVVIDISGKSPDIDRVFQDEMTASLGNKGYSVNSVNFNQKLPPSEDEIKTRIIEYLKKNMPEVRNLILVYKKVNNLGKIGKDIKFSEYDLGESEINLVEFNLSISIVNLLSGETEKGFKLDVKGNGLNEAQAIEVARKKSLHKIEEIF